MNIVKIYEQLNDMKLYVLVDNNTIIDSYYKGEPALSFYIEDDDCKILFDTGYSDIFLKNGYKYLRY